MNDNVLNILIKAQDQASGVMRQVENSMGRLNNNGMKQIEKGASAGAKSFDLLGPALLAVTGGTVALGGAAVFAGSKTVEQAGKFEIYEATLRTMLGTQEKANERMKEYTEINAKTPFELDGIVALGNQLEVLGRYSKDNVIMLGDLAAAAGKPIDQVAGAYSKLVSGQKGVAVDMFRDLLITTDDWVKATGKGVTKNGELMATTEEMVAVLPKIMADKKFSGMMDQQSQTFQGKWSNLMDSITLKLVELGDKILPALKPILDQLTIWISSIDVTGLVNSIVAGTKQVWDFLAPILQWLGDVIMTQLWPAMQELGKAWTELWAVLQPYVMPVLQALGFVIGAVLVGAVLLLSTNLKVMAAYTTKFAKDLKSSIEWATGAWDFLAKGAKASFDFIMNGAKSMANFVIDSINRIIRGYNAIAGAVNLPKQSELPRFASGTNYAPGGLAIVGERGAEIVSLPRGSKVYSNQDSQGMMGGGQTINVNISMGMATVDDRSITEMARRVKSIFIKELGIT